MAFGCLDSFLFVLLFFLFTFLVVPPDQLSIRDNKRSFGQFFRSQSDRRVGSERIGFFRVVAPFFALLECDGPYMEIEYMMTVDGRAHKTRGTWSKTRRVMAINVHPFCLSSLSLSLLSVGSSFARRNNLYGHRNAGQTANKSLGAFSHSSSFSPRDVDDVGSVGYCFPLFPSSFSILGMEIFPQSAIDHARTPDRKGQ